MKDELHSIIITSGTLSPIISIESELKTSFKIKLEGQHIINKEQIHMGIITVSKNNKKQNFKFTLKEKLILKYL